MKRIFQNFQIKASAASSLDSPNISTFVDRLRADYSYCTGLLIISSDVVSRSTLQLKIGGIEIIPDGTDLSYFHFNGNSSRDEVMYSFKESKVPAKGSSIEVKITNCNTTVNSITLTFLLEND